MVTHCHNLHDHFRVMCYRWSSIAQLLSGRTDNEIKNYWNSNLRRRIYTFRNLKELIKTTTNVPKIVVDGDCDVSSRKRDTTIGLEGGSIGSFLPGKDIVDDIAPSRKINSSLCPSSMGDTTLSKGSSIESLLSEDNIVIDRGSTRKNDSSCLGSKDGAMWSEGDSIESFLPKNYIVDIGSIRKSNSLCPGDKDDATWSEEGGSFESLLLENIEINSSCRKWYERGSIESFLLESYIVDKVSNRETNSSCLRDKDEAILSEEGSSIESLWTENYIVDLGKPIYLIYISSHLFHFM